MDEANTKAAVLSDFLDLLDWEIPSNTQLEYSVEAFGQTYKVDYALILEETPVAFIEAKGVDTSLTTDHEEQLSSYMMNKNVTYGILTNGKQYRFFQRHVNASKVNVQKVGDTVLSNLPTRVTVLKAYTKDAIESGESGKILDRINELRKARQTLEAEKDTLATSITTLLSKNVSDSISSLVEPQSKEMIDRIVRDLEEEIISDKDSILFEKDSDSYTTSITESSQTVLELQSKEEEKKDRDSENNSPSDKSVGINQLDKSGKYIVSILDGGNEIAAVSNREQSQVMVDTTNILVDYYDLIAKLEPLPWVPSHAKAIINNKSEWDKAVPVYKKLADGNYIDTKLNKDGKKREIRRMADKCGLEVRFEGDW
ncbi:type I restriction enzyme HsdR N-terminal domain-containing protein [Natrialba hulunbeirensis]|nr:type I restriction enzyme HsdR N-terminal domain-containing protein [Natrialba hulunbeirensis]